MLPMTCMKRMLSRIPMMMLSSSKSQHPQVSLLPASGPTAVWGRVSSVLVRASSTGHAADASSEINLCHAHPVRPAQHLRNKGSSGCMRRLWPCYLQASNLLGPRGICGFAYKALSSAFSVQIARPQCLRAVMCTLHSGGVVLAGLELHGESGLSRYICSIAVDGIFQVQLQHTARPSKAIVPVVEDNSC